MPSIVSRLAELLRKARHPGDFYVSAIAELLPPSLSVDGVGPIAIPLLCAMSIRRQNSSGGRTAWSASRLRPPMNAEPPSVSET
jgi:hypothetical protein